MNRSIIKSVIFCLLFAGFVSESSAQKLKMIQSEGDYYYVYHLKAKSGNTYEVTLPVFITGIALEIGPGCEFGETYIKADDRKYTVYDATEEDIESSRTRISNLISFNEPVDNLIIFNDGDEDSVILHCYNSGEFDSPLKKKKEVSYENYDCSEPEMIYPFVWRAGLPAPTVNPTYTKTQNIVIHHTAGSNSNTNHLSEIRNIYLYHTQTNGWDDIGYNYVIARDGTIYQARDGQQMVDDDFVKGAHFCGKNDHTMGISIMGTYDAELPTDYSLESLAKLLLWKLHKDQMGVLDSLWHPLSGTAQILLPRICGHRDGCATECPGTAFHQTFPQLRIKMDSIIKNCPDVSLQFIANSPPFSLYPNPAHNRTSIVSADQSGFTAILTDMQGKQLATYPSEAGTLVLDVSSYPSGFYLLQIQQNDKTAEVIKLFLN